MNYDVDLDTDIYQTNVGSIQVHSVINIFPHTYKIQTLQFTLLFMERIATVVLNYYNNLTSNAHAKLQYLLVILCA